MSLNHKMGDRHEDDVQSLLGGRRTRGSGNQPANPMDGRHAHFDQAFAFAWDCKSTLRRSLGVTLDMWVKACEQAHAERPSLPIRFYADESLRAHVDLVVTDLDDFAEVLEAANAGERVKALVQGWLDNPMSIDWGGYYEEDGDPHIHVLRQIAKAFDA